MKNLLILLFIFIAGNSSAQYNKLVKKFYSTIDSTHKLECCDSGSYSYTIIHTIPLYQYPVFDKLDLNEYEQNVMNEGYLDAVAQDVIDFYYKIKPSIRSKFVKSCYTLSEDYKIQHDDRSGIYWVEGTLNLKIRFQGKNKYTFSPWYKRIFRRLAD